MVIQSGQKGIKETYGSKMKNKWKSIEVIIFLIWLCLIVTWNYQFPNATSFEDVLVTVCLALFARSLNKEFMS